MQAIKWILRRKWQVIMIYWSNNSKELSLRTTLTQLRSGVRPFPLPLCFLIRNSSSSPGIRNVCVPNVSYLRTPHHRAARETNWILRRWRINEGEESTKVFYNEWDLVAHSHPTIELLVFLARFSSRTMAVVEHHYTITPRIKYFRGRCKNE